MSTASCRKQPSVAEAVRLVRQKQAREKLVEVVLLKVSRGEMQPAIGAEHINQEIDLASSFKK